MCESLSYISFYQKYVWKKHCKTKLILIYVYSLDSSNKLFLEYTIYEKPHNWETILSIDISFFLAQTNWNHFSSFFSPKNQKPIKRIVSTEQTSEEFLKLKFHVNFLNLMLSKILSKKKFTSKNTWNDSLRN